ncbi:WecB/TagA/CpsF family glycosyltransferase [Methylomonas sp. SURF-1]|uniref:WecB/TagA/CpsF family glycosyltransferase n=1 Tax=Methylomonas aurea TaxID=2952224 RepID=A0ABT1UKN0_9GAMM|nr:WecB/TagA/CpsF family glycosyltransferase [Methylomonas sp. SURF-1]MCQ8182797.1 WecB/TagA/CpsF family glycosyltransferase [Methylomonas sp. SURF-1]
MDQGLTPPKTVAVLGIKFPILTYDSALQLFQSWIAGGAAHQVCIANVHTTVASLTDHELRNISNAALTTMDGLPLVWYANLVHRANIRSRVCGPDLMLKCLDHGQARGWRHFFLGGKDEVLADLVKNVCSRFPEADIVGWHSPPFRPLSEEEDKQLVDLINDAKPDFLWVGLGAPKQEKWIASHLDRVNVPVQLGVGAAFDFHSGHIKRAPLWMQKSGLEWVYRMAKDRRLIKRYFSTNPVFLWHFAKDFLLVRILGKQPEAV